ncbi:protein CUP-SHAPED COTYLEDON 3-like [Hibiscus syriacus]|uniref:Protein CUP-SHAPED COTYLEDON 3-like n=1 Tax=Hibiscus syriacus TaxID=106335 RepID=A0A6A3ACC9_HIBSY|nr:protein PLASTID MOVEMENT IMPAIRED 1 [Hibiscus syriacus]KAE8701656.1 protein CUP-SHAPED COTYLEDON 3-like [Hibiscus syriacus]
MATGRRNSNSQLLEELEALSQSLYQSHTSTTRRTASLALPRESVPAIDEVPNAKFQDNKQNGNRPRTRRLSLSPWRSGPKADNETDDRDKARGSNQLEATAVSIEKKGIWNWKPIRVLSHIGMQKLSCLLSVEVVTAQGLPSSMNGLRLSVCVRKKETKDGAVNTMPSRVSQGAADFEETLFVRCNVYCSYGNGKQMKFEPRPFLIYLVAVDAEELDFGRNPVDLSLLIQESVQKSYEGTRVRQWDMSFKLSGKAKGGELIVKLGFQIMEKDGGTAIYNQASGGLNLKSSKSKNFSSSFARKQSKTSFSVPSPRIDSRSEAWTPSQAGMTADLQGLDDLNLDEPASVPSLSVAVKKSEEPDRMEEIDLPEFDVEDKGVEIQEKQTEEEEEKEPEEALEDKSASSEVVKEMVNGQLHQTRLTELDSIAQQIQALESMMGDEKIVKIDEETESQRLDADEETVTREFLQMLENEGSNEFKLDQSDVPLFQLEKDESADESGSKVYLPDLGKGLGCVVQTRDGGYLAAMNPLDSLVSRKDTPKLAMQLSKPMVIPSDKSLSGFELFQKMAAVGVEKLSSQILSSMPLDEIMGKTAELIAFEGIASAIIHGRNKEGANSSAARTIAAVKSTVNAMNTGRKERIATGIWNVNEHPLTAEEILAFSLQKIEGMVVEALKVQAEMAEEEPPFDVSALTGKTTTQDHQPLASAIPLENYTANACQTQLGDPETLMLVLVVQLRDPIRRYEAVGGPVLVLIHASGSDTKADENDEEKRFKVTSLHVGGLKVPTAGKRNVWDSERHRLTAKQWLVSYGLSKPAKKGKHVSKGQDTLWSLSSRVMADMWLKTMRNPYIKFPK